MTKHNLKAKGAAFATDGTTRLSSDGSTSGIGVAVCSCGWTSEIRPSGRARVAAHKEHKEEAECAEEAVDGEIDKALESFLADDDDDQGGNTEAAGATERVEATEPEAALPVERHRSWLGNYSIVMAPESENLAAAYGGIEASTVSHSAMLRVTTFTGREDVLEPFLSWLDDFAVKVMEELKIWQKEHRDERRGQTDMQKYLGNRKFISGYAEKYAAEGLLR